MKFITLIPNAMILPLEKQVCSLELAKRLKELGAPQESWYMWEGIAHDVNESGIILFKYGLKKARDNGNPLRYAAYTVAELGELLPEAYFTRKHLGSGTQRWHWQIYSTFEEDMIKGELLYGHGHTSDTEADARAKMLIYLLEHKLINL